MKRWLIVVTFLLSCECGEGGPWALRFDCVTLERATRYQHVVCTEWSEQL